MDDALEPRPLNPVPPPSLDIIRRRRTEDGLAGRPSFKSLVDGVVNHTLACLQLQLEGLKDSQKADRAAHSTKMVFDVITCDPDEASGPLPTGEKVGIRFPWDWDGEGNPLPGYEEKERRFYVMEEVLAEAIQIMALHSSTLGVFKKQFKEWYHFLNTYRAKGNPPFYDMFMSTVLTAAIQYGYPRGRYRVVWLCLVIWSDDIATYISACTVETLSVSGHPMYGIK